MIVGGEESRQHCTTLMEKQTDGRTDRQIGRLKYIEIDIANMTEPPLLKVDTYVHTYIAYSILFSKYLIMKYVSTDFLLSFVLSSCPSRLPSFLPSFIRSLI